MRRRRLNKFIPESDRDFAFIAESFASTIKSDPARYHFSADYAERISRAVTEFRKALLQHYAPGTSSTATRMKKDTAREKAVELIRKAANVIRADESISNAYKIVIRIKERPKKLRSRKLPTTPPILELQGSIDASGSAPGKHILRFYSDVLGKMGMVTVHKSVERAKPAGASRLELAFDFVPDGEPIPKHPAERTGWPLHLGSFTKNPMEVDFPVPASPMRIVYWARWADSGGRVGPWSKTLVTRVEGGFTALPAPSVSPRVEVRVRERKLIEVSHASRVRYLENVESLPMLEDATA